MEVSECHALIGAAISINGFAALTEKIPEELKKCEDSLFSAGINRGLLLKFFTFFSECFFFRTTVLMVFISTFLLCRVKIWKLHEYDILLFILLFLPQIVLLFKLLLFYIVVFIIFYPQSSFTKKDIIILFIHPCREVRKWCESRIKYNKVEQAVGKVSECKPMEIPIKSGPEFNSPQIPTCSVPAKEYFFGVEVSHDN